MKVLIVEDDLTMRHLMATILSRQNMTCTVVGDGRSAVEEWERGNYDCVFMDVQMPLLDGLQTTRIIREKEKARGCHTIIIAVTALATDADRESCLSSGMDDYLSKPIDIDLLLSIVLKHAKSRSQQAG
jgi:CheY-like chemotaxis protein